MSTSDHTNGHDRDRDHGHFHFELGNDQLAYTPYTLTDPVPTGEQILDAAHLMPSRDYLLVQVLPAGGTKELRREDPVDLRQPGRERFLAFHNDRFFRLTLNDHSIDWGSRWITCRTLATLANVDLASYEVVVLDPHGQNRVLGLDDREDLELPGVERFETVPVSIEVFVNTEPRTVHQRILDFWDVVRLEYPHADPTREGEAYTVTYAKGPKTNPSGALVKGQKVHVKQGMQFNVFVTDRS
jgi:hypothetical protein